MGTNARRALCALLPLALLAGCEQLKTALGDPGLASSTSLPAASAAPGSEAAPATPPPRAATTASDQPEANLVPFALPHGASTDPSPAECVIPGADLPATFKVYAAGAYSGRKLDYQIDQSGTPATRIDVAVNEASMPVVLMLGAYEPTVWNIGWSPDTRIAAVLVSGYHRQVVAGLPASVPRLVSTYDNRGPCGYFYVGKDQLDRLNPLARRLFGKPVDRAYLAQQGAAVVGSSSASGYVTDASQPPDSFRDKDAPLAGEAGLRDAVAKGLLREARSSDLRVWQAAYDAANQRDQPPLSGAPADRGSDYDGLLHNGYVVLKAMRIPAGLYGAHSATFIVPRGVPRPEGNPGHSTILDYNTLTCIGPTCRR